MRDLDAIADRVEIEALQSDFTDAAMMREWDRFASLFTHDGAWRIPHAGIEFLGRKKIQAAIQHAQDVLWEFFVQNTHPGTIELEGDTASGRAHVLEFGRTADGSSRLHYALYHDRYERTAEGWRFTERVYEIRYLDTTPLPGLPPELVGKAARHHQEHPTASEDG